MFIVESVGIRSFIWEVDAVHFHNDVGFWVILILVQDIHFFDVLMARNALEHALFKSAQVDIARIDVIRFLVNFDTQRFARMDFLEITVSDSAVARCYLFDS